MRTVAPFNAFNRYPFPPREDGKPLEYLQARNELGDLMPRLREERSKALSVAEDLKRAARERSLKPSKLSPAVG